ncbi:type I restriction endonuclease subunit R [Actinomadura flavalba]|uniref:type I restriction endonuclease subunit R n=1 Tax=Actinomadura flavalba TaxID=1120938 RepID=UPI000381BFAA|nr:type I restriction endonuclease subunit R [Actinomadura flavalba]
MADGPEYLQVELPLLTLLAGLGWTVLEGQGTALHGRERFRDVLLTGRLAAKLRELNLRDGRPWLDDGRIARAVNAVSRVGGAKLEEANQNATELLTGGIRAEGLPGWDDGRDQVVRYVDWERPERNEFVAVSRYRLEPPGGAPAIVPDVVLFVNGIPLVVIECKAPDKEISAAIDQLLRYADRRGTDEPEGYARLFHTVQLAVATSGRTARLGTITSQPEHYARWRDPFPANHEQLAARLGKPPNALTEQDILTHAVLEPRRLLDIVRFYTLFMARDGKTIKVAPRYQQYRAVEKAIERLRDGRTRLEDGGKDRRGGVVWHTQGSGKSLTMVFLIRKIRATPGLAEMKIVLVTDRKDLQRQLSETAQLSGEQVDTAKSVRQARSLLARPGPGLVFAMIQKQRDSDEDLGVLNTDPRILVVVDEAHRSHGSKLHMNLADAVPNAAKIGFTGTPIIMGAKQRTDAIFGPMIDTYRLKDAEADGAIVPIFYEGYTVKGAVKEGSTLDELFEDQFAEHTREERTAIQRRYGTRANVLYAEEMIARKARHMLRHYVTRVFPGGLKAQLVAGSRRATLRYRAELLAARDELVAEIAALSDAAPELLSDEQAALAGARPRLDLLRVLDFVPVISGEQNDSPELAAWSGDDEDRVVRFQQDFPERPSGTDRPIAFLLVSSKLLTGFDAPIEQVLYLDRSIREAQLLQAIARTNRTRRGKDHGLVVDYYGVAQHLKEALEAYDADDVEGALHDLDDEKAALQPRRDRLRLLFTERGIILSRDEAVIEDCVRLLEDGRVRARFFTLLKDFLSTVDRVLPDPAVKPYLTDAKLHAEIAGRTRARYRDGTDFDPSQYGAKVKQLIDRHVISLGIGMKIKRVALADPAYAQVVEALHGSRARASEMEHAIRHHIEIKLGQDPVRYQRFQERLEEILQAYHENWEQQVTFFDRLREEMVAEDEDDAGPTAGLSPLEAALFRRLEQATGSGPDAYERLREAVGELDTVIATHTAKAGFWDRDHAKAMLRAEIAGLLLDLGIAAFGQEDALASKVYDIVEARLRGSSR